MKLVFTNGDAIAELRLRTGFSDRDIFNEIEENAANLTTISAVPETPDEAAWFAEEYLRAVEMEERPHFLLLKWVREIMTEIALEQPDKNKHVLRAVGLKSSSKGRPSNQQRQYDVAGEVVLSMINGKTLEEAAFDLAEKYDLHESNIIKAYSKYQYEHRYCSIEKLF